MSGVKLSKSKEREKRDAPPEPRNSTRVKFELYGEELIDKSVSWSGTGGRVYCPIDWVDRRVIIIKMD